MALIIAGRPEDVPGLHTVSWRDHPELRLRRGEDFRARSTLWIRSIVLHTTKGLPARAGDPPQQLLTGIGAPVNAGQRCALYWSRDGRNAGAHLVVDHDGTVACCCDLQTEAAYHATVVNDRSIGVEIYQGPNSELYVGQLQAAVALVDWLTQRFGIQRQIPRGYPAAADHAPIRRLERGGEDCVGVFGHRDVTNNRGPGDPGDAIFTMLAQARYERWDYEAGEDLAAWRKRQADLGIAPDGVPGLMAQRCLRSDGRLAGMWVERPGDADLPNT
jgi:hypothetical protein